MTMDMNKDKETLLEEYSDEISRVIVKMYEGIQEKQEKSYYEDLQNGVGEMEAGKKTYQETRAQLDILMKLMMKLEDTFPQYMSPSCIMTEEGVVES